ncbi:MAG: transcription-repair coupling factor [Xanthomonadales bacterium]|nr:transcription-repair coupling factor [Xanthomonadales bacterium]
MALISSPPLADSGQYIWQGLFGSAVALAIINAAAQADRPFLVITANGRRANLLERDLRLLADSDLPILHFADWETLPYDPYSPHPDIVSARLAALANMPRLKKGIVILPISTLLQKIAPLDYILGRSISLHTGQKLNLEKFRETLLNAGYEAVEQAISPGQFAVRGSVLDMFPTGTLLPQRIELFDDEIETIRSYDPESQRSIEQADSIRLLPAREYPTDSEALTRFRREFRLRFDIDTGKCPLYQDVRQGLHPQGLEYYLPLFFEETSNLLDYLKQAITVVQIGEVAAAANAFHLQLADRYEQRRHDTQRPILPPENIYASWETINDKLQQSGNIIISDSRTDGQLVQFDCGPPPELFFHEKAGEPARQLQGWLKQHPQTLIAADSAGRREVLSDTLRAFKLPIKTLKNWQSFVNADEPGLTVLPLETGFCADGMTVLTETQLFEGRVRQQAQSERVGQDPESIIRDLAELNIDAPVVHADHGVGRYKGLQALELNEQKHEFLTLEYAGGDKLYVPVSSLHLISRYTGADDDHAPLHKLGSEQWTKARRKAAKRARDVAAELLDLNARRHSRKGIALDIDRKQYADFAATFEYEETTDQQQAIDTVLADLSSEKPMDRVVCGDVGFGKTEVALRAAFAVAMSGHQVALLAPTTLLAQQHFETFSDRFADWPVRIEILSRFGSGAHTRKTLKDLQNGNVDIVIGTHKLVQPDIRFADLGLVIIDEEQRFGVKQKERMKALRAEVDILTLTATPIPRTLNMAMAGIRELSIIATPPARRLAVKTFICKWDDATIREALQREIQRGGQVYVLHNEVRSIEKIARELEELVPEARLRIAHGQMKKGELESVMRDFYRQRFNILVATTIIESGIDVPSANTIIINRADRFGLSQLHQLRGRVGRSHHRAYAYMIVPDKRAMTRDARKRLEAIASLEELGAGFTLATHDLEIRGAGELLGEDQSGQITAVGFSLYMDLLNRAIAALKSGREPDIEDPFALTSEVELNTPALIPDDYLPDVHTRLSLYKRIAVAADKAALRELQVEMIDRFGLLPDALKNLFEIARLRLQAQQLGIRKISLGENGGVIEFLAEPNIEPIQLIRLIQLNPSTYRLDGPEKLRITADLPQALQRFDFLHKLFSKLMSSQ